MAQPVSVKVRGAREVMSAFRQIDRKLAADFGNKLKAVAEPVATTARGKVTRYAGASVNTIRPRRSGARVFVEQTARKKTGKRGDFGALQMRTVLIPALDERTDEIERGIEKVLDEYGHEAGF